MPEHHSSRAPASHLPGEPLSIDIAPGLDRATIRRVFAQAGRVHIQGFLEHSTASAIYRTLAQDTPWQVCFNLGDRHVDLPADHFDHAPETERRQLVDSIEQGAQRGFQYLFNNFPIHDLYVAGLRREHVLMRVYEFLNSDSLLSFAREVTGFGDIAFADAQATLYKPGHFLTAHDDLAEGKHRRAAYVLNFTPQWRTDWGGILQFIDPDGHVAEGYMPAFNALNLLRVPQKHSVSYVTPWATAGRYSITGWLRAA